MICFGAKTEQEVKEKGTCGSHFKKIKNNKNQKSKSKGRRTDREAERKREVFYFIFYFYFSSLASLFDIWKSDRRNSSGQEAKCSTR